MDLIRGDRPFEELDAAQKRVRDLPWFAAVHECDRTLFESARRNVNLDTTTAWESVHCPVLILYGDRDDSNGPPGPLVDSICHGLSLAHNEQVRVRVFHDADHSLYTRWPARPRRFDANAPPAFVSGYLETIDAWLKEVALRRAGVGR
jgi:pimeloyl-ACP methyl ester carboxylesterase